MSLPTFTTVNAILLPVHPDSSPGPRVIQLGGSMIGESLSSDRANTVADWLNKNLPEVIERLKAGGHL